MNVQPLLQNMHHLKAVRILMLKLMMFLLLVVVYIYAFTSRFCDSTLNFPMCQTQYKENRTGGCICNTVFPYSAM